MSILYISTHVDQVMEILRTRHSMELSELAEMVGLPEIRVEEWCDILEEKGFVRVENKLTKRLIHWNKEKFSLLKDNHEIKKTEATDYGASNHNALFASVREEVEKVKGRKK